MPSSAQHARFPTTQWSIVSAAKDHESTGCDDANKALATLCQDYWHPLYAFLRREGRGPDEAQDLVQGFLLKLIERRGLATADRELGKFRSYLIGALKHYLSSEHDRNTALKRGGAMQRISIDSQEIESRLTNDAVGENPESAFERQWALRILEQAFATLQQEYARADKSNWFSALRPLLGARATVGQYDELAVRLNVPTGNIRVAAHRMKRRFETILRAEIARTLDDNSSVDEEIVALFQALRT